MELQSVIWYKQHRLEEARAEALRAVDICEGLGIVGIMEECRRFVERVQRELDSPAAPGRSINHRSDFDGER